MSLHQYILMVYGQMITLRNSGPKSNFFSFLIEGWADMDDEKDEKRKQLCKKVFSYDKCTQIHSFTTGARLVTV